MKRAARAVPSARNQQPKRYLYRTLDIKSFGFRPVGGGPPRNRLHTAREGGCDGWALIHEGYEIQTADVELAGLVGWAMLPCTCHCHGPVEGFRAASTLEVRS